jgi:iron-sulfur cluster assembly accessory protein
MQNRPETMFVITDSAAEQFKTSAAALGDETLSLRISAKKTSGGMVYNMGFDTPKESDTTCEICGISVALDPDSAENTKGMVIDFREFEGAEQFVFLNPNDSKEEGCETSPDGCDPDGNPTCKSCMDEQD